MSGSLSSLSCLHTIIIILENYELLPNYAGFFFQHYSCCCAGTFISDVNLLFKMFFLIFLFLIEVSFSSVNERICNVHNRIESQYRLSIHFSVGLIFMSKGYVIHFPVSVSVFPVLAQAPKVGLQIVLVIVLE